MPSEFFNDGFRDGSDEYSEPSPPDIAALASEYLEGFNAGKEAYFKQLHAAERAAEDGWLREAEGWND